jgi:hypothetical protein
MTSARREATTPSALTICATCSACTPRATRCPYPGDDRATPPGQRQRRSVPQPYRRLQQRPRPRSRPEKLRARPRHSPGSLAAHLLLAVTTSASSTRASAILRSAGPADRESAAARTARRVPCSELPRRSETLADSMDAVSSTPGLGRGATQMRPAATLGVISTIVWLAGPASAQSTPPSTSARMSVTAEPARPPLPVLGAILKHREELGLTAAQVDTLERVDLARGKGAGPSGGGGGRPSGGGGTTARPGGGGARPPGGGGTAVRPPSGGGGARPPGGGTAVRPPSGGGGGTWVRPPSGGGGGHPPGGGGKAPGPPGGEPRHRRPPDGHRDHGHHDHHGGRAIVGVWPSLWWDPWWEPYWYYAPPPVIIQEPPPVYVQQPLYWYYCQSAQAYHPYVASCPEPWIPVPATPQ